MYKIEIQTTDGPISLEINSMEELTKILTPYEKKYTSCQAYFCEGEATPIEVPQKHYNTKVTITKFDVD